MADEDNKQIQVNIKTDASSASQTSKVVQGAKKDLELIARSARDAQKVMVEIGKEVVKTTKTFQDLDEVAKQAERDLSFVRVAENFKNLEGQIGGTDSALARLVSTLMKMGASSDEITRATNEFKKMGAAAEDVNQEQGIQGPRSKISFRQLRGGLAGVGLGSLGEGAGLVDDLQDLQEGAKATVEQFGNVGGSMQKMIPALAGVNAGVVGTVAVLGPLILVLGAVAAAMKFWEETLKKEAEEQTRATESTRIYYEAISTGSKESIQAQLEQQKVKLDTEKAILDSYQKQRDKVFQDRQQRFGGDVFARLEEAAGADKVLIESLEKQKKAVLDSQAAVDALSKAYNSNAAAARSAAQEATASTRKMIEDDLRNRQMIQQGNTESVRKAIEDRKAEIEILEKGIAKPGNRQALSQDAINLNKELEKRIATLNNEVATLTTTVMPATQQVEKLNKAIAESDRAFKQYEQTQKSLKTLNEEITKMETERSKFLERQMADDLRQEQRKEIEKGYSEKIATARREEQIKQVKKQAADAGIAAEIKGNEARAKLEQGYYDRTIKAYRDFHDAEAAEQDRASRERLNLLKQAEFDLKQLAAAGDVAGFVTRSQQAKLQLDQLDSNNEAQTDLRKRQFDKETELAQQEYDQQLTDLQDSLDREAEARAKAAEERIQEIEEQALTSNTEAKRLEQELNDIREEWRRDDLQRQRDLEEESYNERLALQQKKQGELLQEAETFYDQWLDYLKQASDARLNKQEPQQPYAGGYEVEEYAGGLDKVPYDQFPAVLHRNEKVLTAQQAYDYENGGGASKGMTVNVYQTVGDVVTGRMLEEYQRTTVAGIRQGIGQARGRS